MIFHVRHAQLLSRKLLQNCRWCPLFCGLATCALLRFALLKLLKNSTPRSGIAERARALPLEHFPYVDSYAACLLRGRSCAAAAWCCCQRLLLLLRTRTPAP